MNNTSEPRKLIRLLLVSSLLTVGLSEFLLRKSQAQVIWKPVDSSKTQHSSEIWERTIPNTETPEESPAKWEIVPEPKGKGQRSSIVIWEELEAKDKNKILPLEVSPSSKFTPPTNLEEAEELLNIIPFQSNDFKPLLNLSHTVPTALVLSQEEWNLSASTISPFKYADGTGNQNYAVQLDYGLSDTFQISGFYSEADDPLNAPITGLDVRPANLWKVFGAGARWKFLENKNWSLAFNSSLESWTVGSGGSDSFTKNSEANTSPNIFNGSGKRVETQNLIGSINLPLTWNIQNNLQFTFSPGISFLPPSQGEKQGGAGEFYGTNSYLSGGFLWHPIPDLGLTASITQPIGSGNNNFDKDLKYSKVKVFSGGINWHLNPRISLQGQLTNGFGATPATALLTLPSDNRLGYNAKVVLIPDAADTPQPPFNAIQRSLSLGGLTVNTALVPPNATSVVKLGSDIEGNFETTFGYSISNIFQLNFQRSTNKNIPPNTTQARTYMTDDGINWRGSGKAILTSPLRGALVWSALQISFGRNMDIVNKDAQGYLFTETPITWEATSKIAVNLSPKYAWSGVGDLWGLGLSTHIKLAPRWYLIPEANIVINNQESSNSTLGLRWNATDLMTFEIYCSTASSTVDIGQLHNAEAVRWGGRFITKF